MTKQSKKGAAVRRTVKTRVRNMSRHAEQASSPRKAKARPARARQDDKNAINEQTLARLGEAAMLAGIATRDIAGNTLPV